MKRYGVEYLPSLTSWEDIKKFVSSNKESLEYLKQYEGLDHFLGSGQYGKVFKIKGEELALKVTTDPYELSISNKLLGLKLDTFIEVYYVKTLDSGHGVKILELLYPLNSAQTKFVENIFDLHFFKIGDLEEETTYKNITRVIHQHPDEAERAYLLQVIGDAKRIGLSAKEYSELDLNPGNFLKDKTGNIKVCDL